jgi:hypothetical protein
MSKEVEQKKSATKQDPKATVRLSENKVGDPAFAPEHLHSARAKHLASSDQKVVRHLGADSNHSKNTGTLNQE